MIPDPESLIYDERGLLPVVVQDVSTGAVLMVAWADRAAVERTAETGFACFPSRSRGAPWIKGETSGNRMRVVEARADSDRDTLLLRVRPEGPACHTGARTCFEPNPSNLELGWLARVIAERRGADPEESYTARLLAAGPERIGRKLGEEAMETVLAAVLPPDPDSDGEGDDGKDSLAPACGRTRPWQPPSFRRAAIFRRDAFQLPDRQAS
jgi:phosphoribosyl-ATP pyrophosphohydrolase/phosphoribosyl-AMP cyclohydrolase